jgi:hypothetical protein
VTEQQLPEIPINFVLGITHRCRRWVNRVVVGRGRTSFRVCYGSDNRRTIAAQRNDAMGQNPPRATAQNLGNTIGHRWNCRLLFSLRKRFSDFAGVLDEKLRSWAQRAVVQGNNSDWHAGMLQLNG